MLFYNLGLQGIISLVTLGAYYAFLDVHDSCMSKEALLHWELGRIVQTKLQVNEAWPQNIYKGVKYAQNQP